MLLSEYKMATGDDSVMPGLRRLALEAANGQSIVGSWGHGFAGPDGRLGGYGMMNAPGLPLTISLVLARKAGVNDSVVTRAIDRSVRLLRFYVGKGACPTATTDPWIETHEDNGKCGMASVMFNLLGDAKAAEYFSRMRVASHGTGATTGTRATSSTSSGRCPAWPSPARTPPARGCRSSATGTSTSRARWDGTFLHQGQPADEQRQVREAGTAPAPICWPTRCRSRRST